MKKTLLAEIQKQIQCSACCRYFWVCGRPFDIVKVFCPHCKQMMKVIL